MRINVYVPDPLGQLLSQHKDSINVSAVCQAALQREVQIMSVAHANPTATRLRQSRLRGEDGERADGAQAGSAWASHRAEWQDLLRLSEAASQVAHVHDVQELGVYREDRSGREYEVRELDITQAWDEGFVEGVLKVLNEVEPAVLGPETPPKRTPGRLRMLIEAVREQARWRAEKAEEYPDDARNENAAASLNAMAEALATVPEDHAALDTLDELELFHDGVADLGQRASSMVGRTGFYHRGPMSPPLTVNVSAFLADLVSAHEEDARETAEAHGPASHLWAVLGETPNLDDD